MAARPPALRTVKPGETKPEPVKPKRPKTLSEAIESGTYLETLEAQRRQAVADLPGEKGPAKAALHRLLSILSKEIEELKTKALADREGEGDDDSDADEAFDTATSL